MKRTRSWKLNNFSEMVENCSAKQNKSEQCASESFFPNLPNLKEEEIGDLFQLNISLKNQNNEENQNSVSVRKTRSKLSNKNYCEIQQFQLSDFDQKREGDDQWAASRTKNVQKRTEKRKLIRMTRYIYSYLLKHGSGTYSQIFEHCTGYSQTGKDRKRKRNLQRRFYEAINGMESVGVLKKDLTNKTMMLENLTFVQKLKQDQSRKDELFEQVKQAEKSIESKRIMKNKFKAACAIYREFYERRKKRNQQTAKIPFEKIALPISALHSQNSLQERITKNEQSVSINSSQKDIAVDSELFFLSYLFPTSEHSKELRDVRKPKKKK